MLKTTTMVDFGDILHHATSIDFDWNTAHDLLVNDRIPPMYETRTRDIYFSDLVSGEDSEDPYGYSDTSVRILVSFMVKHSLSTFTLVN